MKGIRSLLADDGAFLFEIWPRAARVCNLLNPVIARLLWTRTAPNFSQAIRNRVTARSAAGFFDAGLKVRESALQSDLQKSEMRELLVQGLQPRLSARNLVVRGGEQA